MTMSHIIDTNGCYAELSSKREAILAEMAYSIRTRPVRARKVPASKRVPRVRVRRELSEQREKCLATYAGTLELQPSL
jgi:hypothetical protein